MAAPISPQHMTAAEFIAWQPPDDRRYEWVAGEVVVVSGPSLRHEAVLMNLSDALAGRLEGTCRKFGSGVNLATGPSYRHPDITVVCGPIELDEASQLTNPTHLVEVLSPSTEAADRNEKWAEYRQLPSLQTYTLVTITDEVLAAGGLVEQYSRAGDLWAVTTWGGTQATTTIAGVDIPLDAIYSGAADLPT